MSVVESDAELVERGLDDAVEPHTKDPGDAEANKEVADGVDEALAELGEVLHQGHAG